jgi:hypothetical protein
MPDDTIADTDGINAAAAACNKAELSRLLEEGGQSTKVVLSAPETSFNALGSVVTCPSPEAYDELIKALVDHGVNANAVHNGYTVLIGCATNAGDSNTFEFAKALLRGSYADVNVQAENQATALMWILSRTDDDIDNKKRFVELLLSHGADIINLKTSDGESALSIAQRIADDEKAANEENGAGEDEAQQILAVLNQEQSERNARASKATKQKHADTLRKDIHDLQKRGQEIEERVDKLEQIVLSKKL